MAVREGPNVEAFPGPTLTLNRRFESTLDSGSNAKDFRVSVTIRGIW